MTPQVNNPSASQVDRGLLLLRFFGLLLFATAGWEKVHALVAAIEVGKPLATVGVAPLIGKMGFPLPVLCALYVVANESLGAMLISIGLFTRVAAFGAALSMTGAFYTAVTHGWEPLRAFIYIFIFAALAASGAGRYSLDSRYLRWKPVTSSADASLLILRAGLLAFFVLLFTLKKMNPAASFAHGPANVLLWIGVVLAALAIVGYFTRTVSILSCLLWGWGVVGGLIDGKQWDLIPYRDAMLVLLFLVLAMAGAGGYSLDRSRTRTSLA